MHQLVKLSDAMWLLQLAISSPLIHALCDPSQAPNWDLNPGSQIEKWTTYQMIYPSPSFCEYYLYLRIQALLFKVLS